MNVVELDEATGELVPYHGQPPGTLFRTDDPREIVKRATETATALRQAVTKAGLTAKIQSKEYPLVEAWTLCGTMLGVFPVCIWTRKLEDGWEARVEARTLHGQVVGAAEAQCTRTERTWASRDDYALRSMAQTRATSKALRQPLGFVMTLSGLEATPAEEMIDQPPSQFKPPKGVSPGKPSAAELGEIAALIDSVTKAGLVDAVDLAERFVQKYGTSVPAEMTRAQADEVLAGLRKMAGQ